ncbi:MAG: DUF4340 domain-containing protein [Patescibacteria group bacterium]
MKFKIKDPLVLSLIILTVCLITFLSVKVLPQTTKQKDQKLFTNPIDQIRKIEISSQNQISQLEKTDQGWIVVSEQNLPADQDKIDRLLEAVSKVEKTDLVSQNATDNQDKYGLDPKTVIRIKINYQNGSQSELLVGNSGPDYQKDYILIPNQSEIYLSNLGLRAVLVQPRWKNLTVTSVYSDQIKKMTVNQKAIDDLESDQTKQLIGQVINLTAEQTQPTQPGQDLGFDQSKLQISIQTEDQTINLTFGNSNQQGQQYLQTDQPEVVYLISSEKFKQISQAVDQLLSENI